MKGLSIKHGMLRDELPNGISGIEHAANLKKAQKYAKKVSMIADGISLAESREVYFDMD